MNSLPESNMTRSRHPSVPTATFSSAPTHTEPKLVVVACTNDVHVGVCGMLSSPAKYHIPTTPAVVTHTTPESTCASQHRANTAMGAKMRSYMDSCPPNSRVVTD
ncbi:hypothetical protein DQ04_08801020 [Trypanosoma grayi]|uniref:hypothetical protein n=1 Tax=Trypanosoma grayi TaxID=71804 RepID=UPI0004F40A53|nr:hypothetical protein DQ04_08801020 [Trypanosoma grayi]KEG07797.1 hypothetical protein DQ04_08801020 [Trypanosoma grayi]